MSDRPEKINLSDVHSRQVDTELLNELRDLFVKAEEQKERYDFTWNGKAKAYFEAAAPTTKTLRAQPEESVNFENSENLFITGDNLETLKLLQESYLGKIDMIYIDPPYNTGKDFVYQDNFKKTKQENDVSEGMLDEDGNRLVKNEKSNGRYHSDWLTMMYPRLKLARNLLSDSGVIFVSIDDNEQADLKLLMDEVFGEGNFLTKFTWEKTQHFGRQKVNYYSNADYIFAFTRKLNISGYTNEVLVESEKTKFEDAPLYNNSNPEKELTFPAGTVKFNIDDGIYDKTSDSKYKLLNPVQVKNGVNINEFKLLFKSRWSNNTVQEQIDLGTTFWVKTTSFSIRAIYAEGKVSLESPRQIIFTNQTNPAATKSRLGQRVDTSENASKYVTNLLGGEYFSYPKPVSLIKYLISLYSQKGHFSNDISVLDFFAGSGTTAEAVMQLNKEDSGNRKFIVVTLDEETPENSEARKAGYTTIDQISRERIRRAAEKIGDTSGFRALNVDSTGLKEDVFKTAGELDQVDLLQYIDNHSDNRSDYDLLYDVLVDGALEYNRPITIDTMNDEQIIKYDYLGELSGVVCYFGGNLTDELTRQIATLKPLIAVFKESTFDKSAQKVNVMEQFRIISPDTKVKVI